MVVCSMFRSFVNVHAILGFRCSIYYSRLVAMVLVILCWRCIFLVARIGNFLCMFMITMRFCGIVCFYLNLNNLSCLFFFLFELLLLRRLLRNIYLFLFSVLFLFFVFFMLSSSVLMFLRGIHHPSCRFLFFAFLRILLCLRITLSDVDILILRFVECISVFNSIFRSILVLTWLVFTSRLLLLLSINMLNLL